MISILGELEPCHCMSIYCNWFKSEIWEVAQEAGKPGEALLRLPELLNGLWRGIDIDASTALKVQSSNKYLLNYVDCQ